MRSPWPSMHTGALGLERQVPVGLDSPLSLSLDISMGHCTPVDRNSAVTPLSAERSLRSAASAVLGSFEWGCMATLAPYPSALLTGASIKAGFDLAEYAGRAKGRPDQLRHKHCEE